MRLHSIMHITLLELLCRCIASEVLIYFCAQLCTTVRCHIALALQMLLYITHQLCECYPYGTSCRHHSVQQVSTAEPCNLKWQGDTNFSSDAVSQAPPPPPTRLATMITLLLTGRTPPCTQYSIVACMQMGHLMCDAKAKGNAKRI